MSISYISLLDILTFMSVLQSSTELARVGYIYIYVWFAVNIGPILCQRDVFFINGSKFTNSILGCPTCMWIFKEKIPDFYC